MRYGFWDVFQETKEGNLEPRRPVNLNGIVVDPGTGDQGEGLLRDYDLAPAKGYDLEGELRRGVLLIRGYYIHALLTSIDKPASNSRERHA